MITAASSEMYVRGPSNLLVMIGELNDEIVGNHFDPINGRTSGFQVGQDGVNILSRCMSKEIVVMPNNGAESIARSSTASSPHDRVRENSHLTACVRVACS